MEGKVQIATVKNGDTVDALTEKRNLIHEATEKVRQKYLPKYVDAQLKQKAARTPGESEEARKEKLGVLREAKLKMAEAADKVRQSKECIELTEKCDTCATKAYRRAVIGAPIVQTSAEKKK